MVNFIPSSSTESDHPQHSHGTSFKTSLKLASTVSAYTSMQMGFSIEFALTGPLFRTFNLHSGLLPLIMLAGPLPGLFIQPVVATLSDKTKSSWGKRRPWIFTGMIGAIIGMLLLGNSPHIGNSLGDDPISNSYQNSIITALVGLWVLDIFLNFMNAPLRCLPKDLFGPDLQAQSSSLIGYLIGLGNFLAYSLGSQDLTTVFPFFETNFSALTFMYLLIAIIFCIPTFITAKEESTAQQGPHSPDSETESIFFPFKILYHTAKTMTKPVKRIWIAFFFSNAGYSMFWIFITLYNATNIFGGDPDALHTSPEFRLYEEGVRWGVLGLALQSVVTMLYTTVLTRLIYRFGPKNMYMFGHLVGSITFFLFFFITDKYLSLISMSISGIMLATYTTIPFTLTILETPGDQIGAMMGVMNLASVGGQISSMLLSSAIVASANDDVRYGLLQGGILCFIGIIFIYRIIHNPKFDSEDDTDTGSESDTLHEDGEIPIFDKLGSGSGSGSTEKDSLLTSNEAISENNIPESLDDGFQTF